MAKKLKLNDLLKIKAWSPISQQDFSFEAVNDNIYRIKELENIYILTSNETLDFEPSLDGPLITMVFWADSLAGALHLRSIKKREESETSETLPPDELLLSAGKHKYGEILSQAKSGQFGNYMESASYKLPENYFLHRSLRVGKKHTFYFRSNMEDMEDYVYAIDYRLQ